MNQAEQLLRLFIRDDEFDFDRDRACQLEKFCLAEFMMASKSRHGVKCRTSADAERVGCFEEPLPNDLAAVSLTFPYVKS